MEGNPEAKLGADNKRDKGENKPGNELDDNSNEKENLQSIDTDDSFILNIDMETVQKNEIVITGD